MSDQNNGAKGAVVGWIKTTIASLFALVSGAVLMYASPLVDRIIKPAKPLANFEFQVDNLKVTFHNRSTGGTEGLWDFGDGTALEPFTPNQETVVHTYTQPGQYSVKLSLQNLIDDKNERTASVNLGGSAPVALDKKPSIDQFDVTAISPEGFAPATFRVASKFKNADNVVWSFGHEYPLEIVAASNTSPERLITLKQPGKHVIKLAVQGGKDVVERSEVVTVNPSPQNALVAILLVSQEAVQVESKEVRPMVPYDFPANEKAASFKLSRDLWGDKGYEIVNATILPSKDNNIKDAKVTIAPDKKTAKLTCEVVKSSGGVLNKQQPLPRGTIQVALTLEKRTTSVRPPQQVAQVLKPGVNVLPLPALPANCTLKQTKMGMQLVNNNAVVWKGEQMPQNAPLQVNGRNYRINAVEANNQVRIELVDLSAPRLNGN